MWIVTFRFTIYDVPYFVANFEYSFSVLFNKFSNGAQFLNITCVAALLGFAVISPVAKI